jgi:hypothetical protein
MSDWSGPNKVVYKGRKRVDGALQFPDSVQFREKRIWHDTYFGKYLSFESSRLSESK